MLIVVALLTVAVFLVVVVGLTNTLRGMRRADGALLENAVISGLRADMQLLSLRLYHVEAAVRTLRHNASCSLHKPGAGPVFFEKAMEPNPDVH